MKISIMNELKFLIFFLFPGFIFSCAGRIKVTTWQVPGINRVCEVNPGGESVIPSGRIVKPYGEYVRINPDPFGMTLSVDGTLALAVHQNSLTLIRTGDLSLVRKLNPYGGKGSCVGAAISHDNRIAYLSGGDSGDIILWELEKMDTVKRISLNGPCGDKIYQDSFTGDLCLSEDGRRLYILDQFNFRMVVFDTSAGSVIASVPTGRFPLGIDLSHDGAYAYVANTGIYDYPLAPGLNKENLEEAGLDFPPYGHPSTEAEQGVNTDGRRVEGLGSPHVPEAVSVWTIDLKTHRVVAMEKTGYRMGEMVEGLEIVGAASPNSIVAGKDKVFVANATNDNISVLDPLSGRVKATINLNIIRELRPYRGLIPFGMALSHDEKRLYVALSGLNSVAVVDAVSSSVLGYIPTGWFPTKVRVSPDDDFLYVATARGLGSGPNGGKNFDPSPAGTYVGDIMMGTFEKINLREVNLQKSTSLVKNNTFRKVKVTDREENPLPALPGIRKSPIRHIVFITKENRTYDEVFGDLEQGRGDPSLARYGMNAMVANRDKTKIVENVNVMPNHRKLATLFAVSDNFYCDSDASVHGHRWMVGTYPNEWVELNSSVKMTRNLFSSAPGRKYVAGSSGAVYPEDYNEAGGMWEHLSRHGIPFFNFGLGFEFSGGSEQQWHKFTGIKLGVMFPMPEPLFDRTSRKFATYNTSVPDQFRVDMFEEELKEKWLSGKEEFPVLITMMLPNDHGAGERLSEGYPFKASYMADNDLALGRVVQILSHTEWWPEMLIIVTEDDAQDGLDHIDAHRSILMMISPWVKRNYVSLFHANFGAILKTIYNLCDIPPLNQFDATATLLQDFFTGSPDFTPYSAVMPDNRIFDPQKALDPYDVDFNWDALKESPAIDNEDDFRKNHSEQNSNE